ncbi:MAG: hypothetical protein ABFS32_18755 [Bacteroidota bacterium]
MKLKTHTYVTPRNSEKARVQKQTMRHYPKSFALAVTVHDKSAIIK